MYSERLPALLYNGVSVWMHRCGVAASLYNGLGVSAVRSPVGVRRVRCFSADVKHDHLYCAVMRVRYAPSRSAPLHSDNGPGQLARIVEGWMRISGERWSGPDQAVKGIAIEA